MSHSPPPFDLLAYEPPTSLWSLVENHVHPHEREEIKTVLGPSLVEQSLELHDEINLLLDIWRDYREETEDEGRQTPNLPEPPAARDRLKQEIRFFVENIRERAQREGRNPERTLHGHDNRVIDYAFERPGSGSVSRPSTAASSRDGRETPLTRRSNSSSDRMSTSSSLSEEVESMSDKLNYLKLEEVVQHLRQVMAEEVEQLLSDISFLQSCLDDEAEYRSESRLASTPPTLTDLREERSKLERELTETPAISTQAEHVMRKLSAGGLVPNSAGKVRPLNHRTSTGNPKGSAPVKASHGLNTSPPKPPSSKDSPKPPAAARSKETSSAKTKTRSSSKAQKQGQDPHIRATRSEIEAMAPAHVTVRVSRATAPPREGETLVKVGSVPVSAVKENGEAVGRQPAPSPPAPPTTAAGGGSRARSRPGSASRFRNMVLSCRDEQ